MSIVIKQQISRNPESRNARAGEIAKLLQQLDTQSDQAAEKGIQKLVRIGKPAVAALMEAAQNQEKRRQQKWCLEALGAIADPRSASILIAALKEKRMTLRFHAVHGLKRMKCQQAAKPIAKLLNDESGGVRVAAVAALEEIGDPAVLPAIRGALGDEKWYVRQVACKACGEFGDKKSKGKLLALANAEERNAVRNAAQKALEQIDPTLHAFKDKSRVTKLSKK